MTRIINRFTVHPSLLLICVPTRHTLRHFRAPRSSNRNTHGTGCTLSSAIAAHLAQGETLTAAVAGAKAYLTGAIGYGLALGRGRGPLWHGWSLEDALARQARGYGRQGD